MEELCSKSAENDIDLQSKILCFLNDKNIDAVTGIRRMGRENLVDFLYRMAISHGKSCSIFPDVSGNVVIFYHWGGIDEIIKEEKLEDKDILFGQDLCHQVPAIVRMRISNN